MKLQELNSFEAPWIAEDIVSSMLLSDDELRKDWETTEVIEPGLTARYGVKDGVSFCFFTEKDLEDKLMACKYFRDREMNKLERLASPVQQDYIITKGLRLELMARGIDVDGIVQSGSPEAWAEIDYIIETEFPLFKLTNRSLLRTKKKKKESKEK